MGVQSEIAFYLLYITNCLGPFLAQVDKVMSVNPRIATDT